MRRLLAWHPEWWMLVLSAGGWVWLLLPREAGGCPYCAVAHGPPLQWLGSLGNWLAMILAMMLPLMIVPVRFAAFGSLRRRRHPAVGAFLASYVSVWMVAGIICLWLLTLLKTTPAAENRYALAAGLLAAACWQATAWKRRLATACHRTRPLAPDGWQAHRDCLLFGADHGMHCVANSGLLMFVAMLSPLHAASMCVVTLLLLYERYWSFPRDRVVPILLCVWALGQCVCPA